MLHAMKHSVINRPADDGDRSSLWKRVASLVPLLLLPAIVSLVHPLAPWQLMWALSIAIFFACKWETWLRAEVSGIRATIWRDFGYLFLWPGMDAEAFLGRRDRVPVPGATEWLSAAARTLCGVILVWYVARQAVSIGVPPLLDGWIGMVGLILTLHFGAFHLLSLAWRAAGVDAQPIMRAPMLATSLSEFWGRRWNLGFRQLSHSLIFQPIRRRLGPPAATLAAFFVSGLIHDLVISLPAGGGYGLPTGYFVLQGIGVLVERSALGKRAGIGSGVRGWVFTLLLTAGPAFWLFHPVFVRQVMLPFFAWIGSA